MSTPFAAVAALLLVLWFGLGRRRPRPLLRSTDTSAIAALNRAQIASAPLSVSPSPSTPDPAPGHAAALPAPADAAGRARLLRLLHSSFSGSSAARLAAIRTARAWGHVAALPVLRRGLRDVDPAVVREAVLAIDRFRGVQPGAASRPPLAVGLPRNVARTR